MLLLQTNLTALQPTLRRVHDEDHQRRADSRYCSADVAVTGANQRASGRALLKGSLEAMEGRHLGSCWDSGCSSIKRSPAPTKTPAAPTASPSPTVVDSPAPPTASPSPTVVDSPAAPTASPSPTVFDSPAP
ncbi:hypothetical protein WJX72_012072 [[Myrmecia] bisecta]|uniref:Uncharacterized protein n=1 Tax=[Myrmecia] bisecta TaxID=41462 RepID=A0AAW1P6P1_9CHLO